ncbi:substrate-binding domain-containing protein, partial [Cellulomonas sp. GbtcB1]|uniref:substrate-binding domain-containing protein n=1 Tax=Cellulomonas sp. GbtcB1 TaxID=2824746 RepID=UPI001C3014EE
AAGIPLDPALLVEDKDFHRSEGPAATEQLLADGVDFDGVFCFNDSLAFGAPYTLGVHRVAVPDKVAVVGYDNIAEGGFLVPP